MEQEDGSLGSESLGKKECKAGRKEALTFSKLAVEAKMSKNLKLYDKFQVFFVRINQFPSLSVSLCTPITVFYNCIP